MLSCTVIETAKLATYSRIDLIHGQHMYTSFMFHQRQSLAQWLIVKTFQYQFLFSLHANLTVQCFCYSCMQKYWQCCMYHYNTAFSAIKSLF